MSSPGYDMFVKTDRPVAFSPYSLRLELPSIVMTVPFSANPANKPLLREYE